MTEFSPVEQQMLILRKDTEQALQKLYQEVGQTLARLAQNIAKEQDALEARIKLLEEQVKPKPLREDSTFGREL